MHKRSDRCLNCGEPTPLEYCPACGQRNVDYRISSRELLAEVLDGVFQFDSRFMRTIPVFLQRPWVLILAYNAGRRTTYTSPLRLYIFLSVAYFFGLSVTQLGPPGLLIESRGKTEVQATGAAKDEKIEVHTGIKRLDEHLGSRIRALAKLDRKEAIRRVGESFLSQAPKGLFFLMPVFALLLKLLFYSSKKFYIEHLIFSLYYHAYAFLLLLLSLLPFLSAVPGWLGLFAFFALLVGLRRVYGDSYGWTVAKLLLLCLGYLVVLSVGGVVLLIVSLLLL